MRVTYDIENRDEKTTTVLLNSIMSITGLITDKETEDIYFNIVYGGGQISIGSETEIEAIKKRDDLIDALNKYLDYHFTRYAKTQIEYMMTKKNFT